MSIVVGAIRCDAEKKQVKGADAPATVLEAEKQTAKKKARKSNDK